MKKFCCLVLALLLLVITPVAAADVVNEIEIFNETFEDYGTSYITCYRDSATTTHSRYSGNSILVSANIANLADLSSIHIQGPASFFSPGSGHDIGRWPITLTIGDDNIGYGE